MLAIRNIFFSLSFVAVAFKFAIFLPIFTSLIKAVPPGFPEVPHLGKKNRIQAISALFDYQAEDIYPTESLEETGNQNDSIFSVKYDHQDWFVKVTSLFTKGNSDVRYAYEWELKRLA